jgi:very-short-patch-repair endonuclease
MYPVHRGVYAIGYPRLTHGGRCMAAALTYGAKAVVSHRSAAELWGLLPAKGGQIVVSVPGIAGKRPRHSVHIHRSRTLTTDAVTSKSGIPITTPTRTIADLQLASKTRDCKAGIAPGELRRAVRQAGVLGLQIDRPREADRTRSELEYLFLRLCKRHGLPTPEVNVRIDSMLVDFLWRERRLIVETDGFRYHGGREAFEDDRERDLRLKALGYDVIRLSYRQVVDESSRVAGLLAAILDRA